MESGEWRVESGKRRTAWWWVSRVAAAACVLFFIVTAVRIWFIPTEGGAPMVAEAEVPEVVLPAATATTAEPEPAVTVARRGQVKPMAVQPVVVVEQEESPVVAEYLVEETPDTVEAPIIIEEVVTPEPVMVAQVEPQVEPLPDPEKAAEPVAKPQEHRRSLFGSLIRRAEPSKMDGTMLAFNLL